jgi:hypothetical protein
MKRRGTVRGGKFLFTAQCARYLSQRMFGPAVTPHLQVPHQLAVSFSFHCSRLVLGTYRKEPVVDILYGYINSTV